eukprot:scaffold11398_cov137-Alexandrium_tamarense.AAC.2
MEIERLRRENEQLHHMANLSVNHQNVHPIPSWQPYPPPPLAMAPPPFAHGQQPPPPASYNQPPPTSHFKQRGTKTIHNNAATLEDMEDMAETQGDNTRLQEEQEAMCLPKKDTFNLLEDIHRQDGDMDRRGENPIHENSIPTCSTATLVGLTSIMMARDVPHTNRRNTISIMPP